MNNRKLLIGAFLVSGCVGLLGEVFFVILSKVLGVDPLLSVPFILLLFGVIGVVLLATGTYSKLERASEMGIMGTFVALVPIAAGITAETKEKTGSAGRGAVNALRGVLSMIVIGAVLPVLFAVIKTLFL